jgi:hypothetical protein
MDDGGKRDAYGPVLSSENGLAQVVTARLENFGSFWEAGEYALCLCVLLFMCTCFVCICMCIMFCMYVY